MSDYHQVWISGSLTTESALHIGTGEDKEIELPAGKEKTQQAHYSACCLGVNNTPYLPASSLRGILAEAAQHILTPEMRLTLFGGLTQKNEGYIHHTGCLRLYDAFLKSMPTVSNVWSAPKKQMSSQTLLRTSVGIDPILGVADAHRLFNLEVVPSGASFTLELSLEACGDSELQAVLQLLNIWKGSSRFALGSGSGVGRGRVRWNVDKVAVLDQQGLENWLASEQGDLIKAYRVLPTLPELPAAPEPALYQVAFSLIPQGSFLLHDPAYCEDKPQTPAENKIYPDLTFSRTPEGKAVIPATALKGWLRGRVRRILLTLKELTLAQVESLLAEVFGSEQQRGILRFEDAVSVTVAEPFFQSFNAIDRFTGGVADGALFTVEAARCMELQGKIIFMQDLPMWAKAVLLWVERDVLEGELSLGWGKSRGFGNFAVTFVHDKVHIQNTEQLQAAFPVTQTSQWFQALSARLESLSR